MFPEPFVIFFRLYPFFAFVLVDNKKTVVVKKRVYPFNYLRRSKVHLVQHQPVPAFHRFDENARIPFKTAFLVGLETPYKVQLIGLAA